MAIPFIQARHYTRTDGRAITLVVLHSMEAPEKPATARAVANWFAGTTAPRASAHYCVDNAEVIQCVKEQDVAWHAPGANHNGIGIEHAGYARQSLAEWSDPYSIAMLRLSARLTADLCAHYDLPVRSLTAAELVAGQRGITTHAEVSKAWRRSDHWDPGPNFPMAHFLNLVRLAMPGGAPGSGPPTVSRTQYPGGEDMLTRHDIDIPALDGQGRGWVELDVPAATVVSIVANGPYPPVDNYWELPVTARQDRGGKTVVSITEGPPNGRLLLSVWSLT